MKRRAWIAAVVIAGVGGLGAERLAACGDKYLNLGLGTHYHRSAAERRAAAVLIYANPASQLSRLMSTLPVEAAMNKDGYHPLIAASPSELDAALHTRKWDVIVVDGRDTATVTQRVQKPSLPHLVPVLTKPTKDELKQAQKTYDTVLNTPTRTRTFVDAVDDAMDLHEVEERAAAKAAKAAAR